MSLMPNNNKSLINLFENAVKVVFSTLHCIKIGEIQSFDKQNQTATVKILHKKINEFNLNERELNDYSLLEQVPIVVMGGGGTYITHPIKQGDQCLLLFNDYELDGWWSSGEGRPSYFSRNHDISDAIAIVGLNSLLSLIQNYSDFLELHFSDSSKITIGDTVEIVNTQTNVSGNLTVNQAIVGKTTTTSELHDSRGISGTFTDTGVSASGMSLTITDGIITGIG